MFVSGNWAGRFWHHSSGSVCCLRFKKNQKKANERAEFSFLLQIPPGYLTIVGRIGGDTFYGGKKKRK